MVVINFVQNKTCSKKRTKLVNSAVHVVASEYICFPNQAVKTFAGKIV